MIGRILYLIPEFPGQTHIWMWREMLALRNWGVEIQIVSTRPPAPHERARHVFADDTLSGVRYIYDRRRRLPSAWTLLRDTAWAAFTRPLHFIAALFCVLRLA